MEILNDRRWRQRRINNVELEYGDNYALLLFFSPFFLSFFLLRYRSKLSSKWCWFHLKIWIKERCFVVRTWLKVSFFFLCLFDTEFIRMRSEWRQQFVDIAFKFKSGRFSRPIFGRFANKLASIRFSAAALWTILSENKSFSAIIRESCGQRCRRKPRSSLLERWYPLNKSFDPVVVYVGFHCLALNFSP